MRLYNFSSSPISSKDSTAEKVFVRNGNQGGEWLQGRVSISMNSDYNIIIRHIRGDMSVETGVAIDDIKFSWGACCE